MPILNFNCLEMAELLKDNMKRTLDMLCLVQDIARTHQQRLDEECLPPVDPNADVCGFMETMKYIFDEICCFQHFFVVRVFVTECNRQVGIYLQSFTFSNEPTLLIPFSGRVWVGLDDVLDNLKDFVGECEYIKN